ncbi:MFS transporter [Desulfatibacillum aliphaticivorans]|uniref:MFS transporter n=1 Tax=Desulfatibacillum aliphaticivorans TaxID=218208 RepID=UPI0003F89E06|nr:MFS transporter [Desulfatibacillum aliphaticivorans]
MTDASRRQENPLEEPAQAPLLTAPFVLLILAFFLGLCNMAVFFNFYACLIANGVEAGTAGFLLGLFSLTALIVRPFISPLIHPGNALPWIGLGAAGMILCLGGYTLSHETLIIGIIRAAHGLSFVVMVTAVISSTVGVISPQKSGLAFGIMSIVNLLPFAIIPALVEFGLSHGLTQANIYMLAAASTALVFPLLLVIKRLHTRTSSAENGEKAIPTRREIMNNFKRADIILALSLGAVAYLCFAIIFMFLKSYGPTIGVEKVSPFFALATVSMIGIRLASAALFDHWNKVRLCTGALIFVGLMFLLLQSTRSQWCFYASGALLGLGWGIAMPVIMAIVFNLSEPRLRAFNTNMMIEMVDLGYFLGPFLGGLVVSSYGYSVLFFIMSAVSIIFGLLALRLAGKV